MHKRKNGRIDFSKKDRKKMSKNQIEEIMNKKNDRDHVTSASIIEGPIKNVTPCPHPSEGVG